MKKELIPCMAWDLSKLADTACKYGWYDGEPGIYDLIESARYNPCETYVIEDMALDIIHNTTTLKDSGIDFSITWVASELAKCITISFMYE